MNTLIGIIAIAVMLVALVLLVSKRSGKKSGLPRPKKKQSTSATSNVQSTQWRAVKISPGLISCSAVQKLAYTKFLARDCPSLPLSNCSQRECQCKYIHHEDRRADGDRRVDLGELDKYMPVNLTERRQVIGRRTTDLAA
jgi:hypothetical protein